MSIGGSAGKSSQKGSTASSYSATPIAPQWILDRDVNMAEDIQGVFDRPVWEFYEGANAQQNDAAGALQRLVSQGGGGYGEAADVTRAIANRSSDYTNPYRDQVLNAAMADWDANEGKTRAAQDLDIARSGAFGGSGAGVTKSLTEAELARGRASALSGLLNDMFDKSSQLGLQSDALKLQAGGQLGSLQGASDANTRANAQASFDAGEALRQIREHLLQAPISQVEKEAQIRQLLDLGKYFGEQGSEVGSSKGSGSSFGLTGSWSPKV